MELIRLSFQLAFLLASGVYLSNPVVSAFYGSNSHRHPISYPPPETCGSENRPCYQYVLSFLRDGVTQLDTPKSISEASDFINHYRAGGFTVRDIICTGQEAAKTILTKFGLDFTVLPPENFLKVGGRIKGVASMRPFFLNREGQYRLLTATNMDKVQSFDTRVDWAGWHLTFEKDFMSRGTFEVTAPKGSAFTVGSYVIWPCLGVREYYGPCRNILNPSDPTKPIFIRLESRELTIMAQPAGNFGSFHADLRNDVFGMGQAVGAIYSGPNETTTVRNILTFQGRH